MAPNNGAFAKLVTTDTSATSLVVGGATGSASTGTGGIYAGYAVLNNAAAPLIAPLAITGGGAAGAYTSVNSALIWKNAAAAEIFRLHGTGSGAGNHRNLYLGYQAGLAQPTDNVTAGSSNLGIGTQALKSITLGTYNLAIGETALEDLTEGDYNLAIGVSAGANITTADNNIAIGPNALNALLTGTSNTAVGESALNLATGNSNVALGYRSLGTHVVGDQNTSLGTYALGGITTTTASCVSVGYEAGRFITATTPNTQATQSIYIGARTRAAAVNLTNEIVIGYNADGNGSNTVTLGNTSATHLYAPPTLASGISFAAQFLMTGTITPTQLVSNTDNWNPTGLSTANVIRIDASGAINLTGIVAQASGRIIALYNLSANVITCVHDATSTAANRFYCPNNINQDMGPHETFFLRYDGTDQRWTMMGNA